MSNRINGFTVVFENSVSEEYMNEVKSAIGLYKGVIAIEPNVQDVNSFIASRQENIRIRTAIFDFFLNDAKK